MISMLTLQASVKDEEWTFFVVYSYVILYYVHESYIFV